MFLEPEIQKYIFFFLSALDLLTELKTRWKKWNMWRGKNFVNFSLNITTLQDFSALENSKKKIKNDFKG